SRFPGSGASGTSGVSKSPQEQSAPPSGYPPNNSIPALMPASPNLAKVPSSAVLTTIHRVGPAPVAMFMLLDACTMRKRSMGRHDEGSGALASAAAASVEGLPISKPAASDNASGSSCTPESGAELGRPPP